jgi:signal transduction histidine kinase
MAEDQLLQPDHQSSMRQWRRTAPLLRRLTMGLGLEGKLIIGLIIVLSTAMGLVCTIYVNMTREHIAEMMGEQARQVASALALNGDRLFRNGEWQELNRRAQELIKSRNVLYVGYFDSNARPMILASRDLEFGIRDLSFDSQSLMQVRRREARTFGHYLEVVAPILSLPWPGEEERNEPRLLGYVTVGVSQMREDAEIYRANWMAAGIAGLLSALAVPAVFLLVHRVFMPIRLLVAVSRRIAAGDMNARAEIHRPDQIGILARAFDDMVMRVKQQQQALADANRDLERRIEQRTAQLEQANTRLSTEIAEKEEFVRAVSHDLNAPLRNISGMVTMLLSKQREGLEEDVIYRLERIKSNVEVESSLIAELLELSRIKTRRQKMEPVDLDAMINELRGMFEIDFRERAIELVVDTPLPRLDAERARIRQLFQNLIDNAIKYMGDGEQREIHVGCTMQGAERLFYVRDTGIGIHPDDQAKVFLVFRRGRNAAMSSGKGVGLSTVKSIVETYNGKIWVSSAVGAGSTFYFTLNEKTASGDGKLAA